MENEIWFVLICCIYRSHRCDIWHIMESRHDESRFLCFCDCFFLDFEHFDHGTDLCCIVGRSHFSHGGQHQKAGISTSICCYVVRYTVAKRCHVQWYERRIQCRWIALYNCCDLLHITSCDALFACFSLLAADHR